MSSCRLFRYGLFMLDDTELGTGTTGDVTNIHVIGLISIELVVRLCLYSVVVTFGRMHTPKVHYHVYSSGHSMVNQCQFSFLTVRQV